MAADIKMIGLEEMGDLRSNMDMLELELMKNHGIDPNLYVEYDVKRGLRDSSGKGVLTGLTEISDVSAYELVNGRNIPADGKLYYQGINVQEMIEGLNGRKFGFEEAIYLLMFGKLPSQAELDVFFPVMFEMEELSGRVVR
ncbi:MAG: citrate synthase, partial [Clostridiales bacterium]|nr:citrate synthase [Clostridiales bacterium]